LLKKKQGRRRSHCGWEEAKARIATFQINPQNSKEVLEDSGKNTNVLRKCRMPLFRIMFM
jgi:hypothetical protein